MSHARYFIRVTITRSALYANVVQEFDFAVQNLGREPEINNSIKMEVGIEDCLHIEFEYNKSKYHLQDVVLGKIYFLLVRIKIKHMEVEIRRRETTATLFGLRLPLDGVGRLRLEAQTSWRCARHASGTDDRPAPSVR